MYIEVKDLKKKLWHGDSKVQVLRGVTTEVEQGKCALFKERVVLVNPRY